MLQHGLHLLAAYAMLVELKEFLRLMAVRQGVYAVKDQILIGEHAALPVKADVCQFLIAIGAFVKGFLHQLPGYRGLVAVVVTAVDLEDPGRAVQHLGLAVVNVAGGGPESVYDAYAAAGGVGKAGFQTDALQIRTLHQDTGERVVEDLAQHIGGVAAHGGELVERHSHRFSPFQKDVCLYAAFHRVSYSGIAR